MKVSSLAVLFLAFAAEISTAKETGVRSRKLKPPPRNRQSGDGNNKLFDNNQNPPNNDGNPPPPQNGGDNNAPPGDLNVRFNKIGFPDIDTPGFMPLKPNDYPIRGDIAQSLKQDSSAVSVITANDPELHGGIDAQDLIRLIGGPPSMPNSQSMEFWDDFLEVINVQETRLGNGTPAEVLQLPDLWAGLNIHEVAEAVHDEYPGAHQVDLIKWLWGEGVQLDYRNDVIPFRSSLDFVGLVIRLADLNTWAIGAVSPTNFHLKWYVGRPRPEEVAFKIASGELTTEEHGVPSEIVRKISDMNLQDATDFTAYDEGSPTHPSWPAMHSAASSASFWLAVVLDLNSAQYCEALRVDYAVSYARTVAGVHYPTDNIAGLNLGQHIMAEQLAAHMASKYGSNQAAVQAKIEDLRFNWADFDPDDCSGINMGTPS
jgi:membrane-associated phospholipid phosphatase